MVSRCGYDLYTSLSSMHTHAMAGETHRTGFMDLPLELRQRIYSYVLPREERNILSMCTINPDSGEAMDVIYQECSVHITIQPERATDFLDGIELHRFRRITVLIDNYASGRLRCEGNLTGISTFVKLLQTGRPENLPPITISFLEDEYGYKRPSHDSAIVAIMNVLLALPPCESATVYTPRQRNTEPWEDYIQHCCNALNLWLRGRKPVIPSRAAAFYPSDLDDDHKETELERLANLVLDPDFFNRRQARWALEAQATDSDTEDESDTDYEDMF